MANRLSGARGSGPGSSTARAKAPGAKPRPSGHRPGPVQELVRHGPRSMQHPAFQRVWITGVLTYLSRFIDFTVIAWLVVDRTDASAAVGLLVFFRYISFLLLGPFIGLVADRYPRIKVLRLSQVCVSLSALGLGLLLLLGDVQLWHLYVYTFVTGVLFVFDISTRRPYMSSVVGPKHLTAALALDMMSMNAMWFLGSNLGGMIVANVGAGYVYVGLAAVYMGNVAILRGLPVLFRREMAEAREPVYKSLKSGVSSVRKNRLVMGGLLVVAVNNFSGYTFESMGPVFFTDVFGAGPTLFGLLMSAQGLGSLAIAVVMVFYGRRIRRPGLVVLAAAAVQHLGSILFSFTGNAAAGFVVLLWLGTVSMTFGIMHTTLVLAATPDRVRGRIVGLQILAMGLFPVGSLAVGELADAIGLQSAVRVFALGGLVALAVIALAFPELRRRLERPGGEATRREPEERVAGTGAQSPGQAAPLPESSPVSSP